MRSSALVLMAVSGLAAGSLKYRGYVNPLNIPQDDDPYLVYANIDGQELEQGWQHQMTLIEQFIPFATMRSNRQRFLVGTSDCNTTTAQMDYSEHAASLVEHEFSMTKSLIHFGAGDAVTESFTAQYAKQTGVTGIFIEKDEEMCKKAMMNLGKQSLVICEEVTPMNVIEVLEKKVPSILKGVRHFDLIRVEIQSYDAAIIKALMDHHITAKHWSLQLNPSIPPPYQFSTGYHPKLWEAMTTNSSLSEWPLRGMSLSYAVNMMKKAGYHLVSFAMADALFVHENYQRIYGFATPYDEFDCYHKAFVLTHGVPVRQLRKWFYESSVEQGVAEIFQHMIRVSLPASNGKYVFPFTLEA